MIAETHHENEEQPFLLRNVIDWLRSHGIMAHLKNVVAAQVPVGYEDETGFHLGVPPAPVRAVSVFAVKTTRTESCHDYSMDDLRAPVIMPY
jgi:stringent starvation protein B